MPELHTKTFMHWMTNIQRLVHLAPAVVGPPIPGVVLRRRPRHRRARETPTRVPRRAARRRCARTTTSSTPGSRRRCGRSRRSAGPTRRASSQTFYPNNVLVTGPDIIFFWVARMMMMGIHFMGKVPFRTVYLTSIVTDENGDEDVEDQGQRDRSARRRQRRDARGAARARRVRRSRPSPTRSRRRSRRHFAEGMPPMGADALRFALAALNTGGSRIRLSLERVEDYRNFINKLWNASRFALMNLDGYDPARFEAQIATARTTRARSACRSAGSCRACSTRAPAVDAALEAFRFADAAQAIWHFVWDELCDWYIELAKPHLHQSDELTRIRRARRGVTSCRACSRRRSRRRCACLHPFAPFVTEEIWQKLPKPPQLPELADDHGVPAQPIRRGSIRRPRPRSALAGHRHRVPDAAQQTYKRAAGADHRGRAARDLGRDARVDREVQGSRRADGEGQGDVRRRRTTPGSAKAVVNAEVEVACRSAGSSTSAPRRSGSRRTSRRPRRRSRRSRRSSATPTSSRARPRR